MTYVVKPGDTLAGILKKLGVSSYSSPATWALVRTKSGNPGKIYSGETLDLSRVLGTSGSSTTAAATPAPETESERLARLAAEKIQRKDAFHNRFGTLEQNMPLAALQQFAEQQVNPEAFRMANEQMRNIDWRRAISGSGAQMSGYGTMERSSALDQLERQRKEMVDRFVNSQKDLFSDWYRAELNNYMTSADPSNYQLNLGGLGGEFAKLGWTNNPSQPQNQYSYNPIDMRDYFKNRGVSGYQAAPLNNLWGTIT